MNFVLLLGIMLQLFIWAQLYMKCVESLHALNHIRSPENFDKYESYFRRLIYWTLFCFFVMGVGVCLYMAKDTLRILETL